MSVPENVHENLHGKDSHLHIIFEWHINNGWKVKCPGNSSNFFKKSFPNVGLIWNAGQVNGNNYWKIKCPWKFMKTPVKHFQGNTLKHTCRAMHNIYINTPQIFPRKYSHSAPQRTQEITNKTFEEFCEN